VIERADTAAQMVVSLARLLRDGETVFFGVASPIPMVAALLARRLHAPNLVILTIAGGVSPLPEHLPASTVDPALLHGARAQVTLTDIFDLSARGRLDTAFLGGVQIDDQGRINMSAIGDFDRPKVRLPGGAGSAAIMPTARRTILWRTRHDPRTFVETLGFVTAAGNVEHVVTPLCVFGRAVGRPGEGVGRRTGGLAAGDADTVNGDVGSAVAGGAGGGLAVESIHASSGADEVRVQTGFAVHVGPETPTTPPPSDAERAALRDLDPENVAATELRGR